MEPFIQTRVPARCLYIIYQSSAAFLLHRIDGADTAFKAVRIKNQKHDVCADYAEEENTKTEVLGRPWAAKSVIPKEKNFVDDVEPATSSTMR